MEVMSDAGVESDGDGGDGGDDDVMMGEHSSLSLSPLAHYH